MIHIVPILIGVRYAAANSLIHPQHRRPVNAVVLAGAGTTA